MINSFTCVVVIELVDGEFEDPVLLLTASSGFRARTPVYSITAAETLVEIEVFNVIVTDAPLVALASAYQISVVTPLLLVACVARVQVVPVCEMLETVLAPLFLVETTAINVFPLVGAASKVTVQEVAPFALPVVPVLDCTLVNAVGEIGRAHV